jgi:hypothetical protein
VTSSRKDALIMYGIVTSTYVAVYHILGASYAVKEEDAVWANVFRNPDKC